MNEDFLKKVEQSTWIQQKRENPEWGNEKDKHTAINTNDSGNDGVGSTKGKEAWNNH